jgi:multiple sugar transport system substrate-binding protein
MRMKKRLLTKLLAVAIAATMLFLVGCANDAPEVEIEDEDVPEVEEVVEVEPEPEPEPEEPVEVETGTEGVLNVLIWDSNQQPGIQTIIDEFTAATGIQAEIQVIPWGDYWTLLEASAGGGDMPDVMWMHSNEVQRYMDHGFLMDLTDFLPGSNVNMAGFPDDIIDLYNLDGRQYAVPKDIDTIAIWYNVGMFEEAGVEFPNDTWTWEDFYDAAVALTTGDGQYGLAWSSANNQDGYWNVIYSFGGYVINEERTASGFDNPNTIAAMEFVERLVRDATLPIEYSAIGDQHVHFEAGIVGMITMGSWMVPAFRDNEFFVENARVAVLPMHEDGTRISIYNGLGWAASADTDMPDEAKALIEWFGTREMQLRQAELGVTMSAYEGTSDAWVGNTAEFDITPYLVMLDDVVLRPYSRATGAWEFPIVDILTRVWAGEITMLQGLEEATILMNEALEDELR